jgi:hypothetical protein
MKKTICVFLIGMTVGVFLSDTYLSKPINATVMTLTEKIRGSFTENASGQIAKRIIVTQ